MIKKLFSKLTSKVEVSQETVKPITAPQLPKVGRIVEVPSDTALRETSLYQRMEELLHKEIVKAPEPEPMDARPSRDRTPTPPVEVENTNTRKVSDSSVNEAQAAVDSVQKLLRSVVKNEEAFKHFIDHMLKTNGFSLSDVTAESVTAISNYTKVLCIGKCEAQYYVVAVHVAEDGVALTYHLALYHSTNTFSDIQDNGGGWQLKSENGLHDLPAKAHNTLSSAICKYVKKLATSTKMSLA